MRKHYLCFPHIRSFPEYDADGSIALVIRLWSFYGDTPQNMLTITRNALWCMRAWLLNFDAQAYNVQPIFYVHFDVSDIVSRIVKAAGVPNDAIHVWSPDIVRGAKGWGLNAAPIVDRSFDTFEHVVIVDEDFFPVRAPGSPSVLPVFEVVTNQYPTDMFTCGKGWTDIDINGWINKFADTLTLPVSKAKSLWLERAAYWCNATPSQVSEIMMPTDKPKPRMDGFFIHLPMHWVRAYEDFRRFMHGKRSGSVWVDT